jgi:LysM repeat protein
MKKLSLILMIAATLVLVTAQLGWATPKALAAPPSYGRVVHIVRWGETLSGIAYRYGTTVHAIASYNGIVNPNCIYAGQRLVIPSGHGPGHPGPGHPGPGHPGPGHPGPGHPSHGFYYTVRWGDTLSGIAWRFGRNVWTIASDNGIYNPNCIYAGQRLWIR